MKIHTVKISGFRGIPFCASYIENPVEVIWEDCAFQIHFSTKPPLLSAIIGPNSCGKSSILYALQYFFGSTTRQPNEEFYNFKDTNRPIIIEVTFKGNVLNPGDWHRDHCQREGEDYLLTLLSITNTETRLNLIRNPNGELKKQSTPDKDQASNLLPKFRLIPADSKIIDEINPEKKNLATDLIDDLLSASPKASNRTIQYKLQRSIDNLKTLVTRDTNNNSYLWKDIEKIESSISSGLLELAPGKPQVRFNIKDSIPSLQSIFTKGKFSVVDGVDIGFEGHGLGIQRTFLISILNTWATTIGHKKENQDYVFAIEEPELYLHPHAIRALLTTLDNISKQDQVIFSSHVGEFVNNVPLDNVIKIHRVGNSRVVIQPDLTHLNIQEKTKVQRYLLEDKSDMLFARGVLLVEGQTELFAIPNFARKLNIDLNKKGISIVFTNGIKNFPAYHHILAAFGIPHVILADGDGKRDSVLNQLNGLGNEVIVLEEDFEYLVASLLTEKRLLTLINHCRKLQGQNNFNNLNITGITSEQLRSSWWNKLVDDINADIVQEHRNQYSHDRAELKRILDNIALNVVENNHLLPTAQIKKRAALIKKQTKPLAGRVMGELLSFNEIMNMPEICQAINRTIELAD